MYCTYEYTWINIPDRLQISGLLQKKGRLQCEKWLLIDLSRRGRDRLRHTEWAVSAVARQRVLAEDPLKRRHYGATGQCRHPQIGWNRVPIQLILPYLKTFLVIGYQGTRFWFIRMWSSLWGATTTVSLFCLAAAGAGLCVGAVCSLESQGHCDI